MNENRYSELKQAEKGALISIIAYIAISGLKLAVGSLAHSEALRADGLNNSTDIIASVAVLIGLRVSRKPADADHRYGHWKAENVASLITSMIMLAVGLEVLYTSLRVLFLGQTQSPDMAAAIVGIFSAIVMYGVYFYNKRLAKKMKSPALLAAAKDNRSDAWTSIGTAVAIFAASFDLGFLDSITAVIVAGLILKTAIEIFKDSSFSLSDGFDQQLLADYAVAIAQVDNVAAVKNLRGRMYGANVFLDVVICVNKNFTVEKSHQIADEIEELMAAKFGVFDSDIHIEPA